MSKLTHPKDGEVKEYAIKAIACHSDSEGLFYELYTTSGLSILTGMQDGEPCVHVEGHAPYGGPEAERVLKWAREEFKKAHGVDPESHSKLN